MKALARATSTAVLLVLMITGCSDDAAQQQVSAAGQAVADAPDRPASRLDTGGYRLGEPAPGPTNPVPWIDAEGRTIPDLVPDYLPICDPRNSCETIVGFIDAVDWYPDLAEVGDPRLAELGYQPGPMEVVNEFGEVVGYLPPDETFMTPSEFREFEARTDAGTESSRGS